MDNDVLRERFYRSCSDLLESTDMVSVYNRFVEDNTYSSTLLIDLLYARVYLMEREKKPEDNDRAGLLVKLASILSDPECRAALTPLQLGYIIISIHKSNRPLTPNTDHSNLYS